MTAITATPAATASATPAAARAAPSAPVSTGLHEWPSQVLAVVTGVHIGNTKDEREIALRLLEIGFLPGETVRVLAYGSPGRDPLAVRVGRSTFALRRHEAALVDVQPLDVAGDAR